MARWENRLLVAALVLAAVVAESQSQSLCPDRPTCFGCNTSAITCEAGGLTSFPVFSVAHQQLVETLSLSSNGLSSLSFNDLENFTSLQVLDVSSNNIQSIEPGTFSQSVQLREIDFEDNNLQEIPENLFANTSNLVQLNFQSNNIENITSATFLGLPLSAEIDLTDNPLNCDCGLRWLPDFINSSEYTGVLLGSCSSPANLSTMDINILTKSQLLCDCITECGNGTCDVSLGQCTCNDGYTGDDCSLPCTPGTYGAGCQQNCSCVEENEASPCNIINGTCYCLPGYRGDSCQYALNSCSNGAGDCEDGEVCLGRYSHPSTLPYPFRLENYLTCVDKDVPGQAILQQFKDALLGREDVLSQVPLDASLDEVEASVQQELEIQFDIEGVLEPVTISVLQQDEGKPLYQTGVEWSEDTPYASVDRDIGQMIANMNGGKLKGTMVINKEDRRVILNI